MTLLDQFAGRFHEDGDCLVWTGACCGKRHHPAYSNYTPKRKTILVRRALWEEKHGPIPAGKIVRCTCGTERCINIEHFELSTFKRVALQCGELGLMSDPVRSAKIAESHRARHPLTKLSQAEARDIRMSDEPGTVLAARYGISEATVSKIRLGQIRREFTANPWQGLGA